MPTLLVAVTDTVYVVPFVSVDHAHAVVGALTVHVADPEPGAGEIVAVYEATVPPLPAGAVHDADTAPSEGVSVSAPGASGDPLHAAVAAVETDDTQLFSRAFTAGVTAVAGTVTDAEVPATPVATVDVPSVTSYVSPDGSPDAGVQDTRQVVAAVREAVTAVGT